VLALLRTRRWIGFTVVVLVAIVGFGILSRWQWSRAEDKHQESIRLAAESQVAPVPVEDLLPSVIGPDLPALDPDLEWRTVVVTGTYRSQDQVLVRKRPLDGRNGFWVLAPLTTADGGTVWVNRGWVPAAGTATAEQAIPPTPSGEVTVTGRVRPTVVGPRPQPDDLPAGQVSDPDVGALTPPGATTVPAYVELVSSDPADRVATPLPLPQVDESRNISYAVQWILFALVALVGWWFFLRREAREDATAAPTPVSAPQP
jgi:cytochrome oxidase assembly protein ShyY1